MALDYMFRFSILITTFLIIDLIVFLYMQHIDFLCNSFEKSEHLYKRMNFINSEILIRQQLILLRNKIFCSISEFQSSLFPFTKIDNCTSSIGITSSSVFHFEVTKNRLFKYLYIESFITFSKKCAFHKILNLFVFEC